jgi:hypothetical protein
MRQSPFIRVLERALGDSLVFSTAPVEEGTLRADTIEPDGFSLRAYSRDRRRRDGVSLLHITDGQDRVGFSSHARLSRCLPGLTAEVDAYADLLVTLGVDIRSLSEGGKGYADIALCTSTTEELAQRLKALR